MKNFLFLLFVSCLVNYSYSQCTIIPQANGKLIQAENGVDTVINGDSLTVIYVPVDEAFAEVFQVRVPFDTISGGVQASFDNVELNAVNNLPSGLSYQCNPFSCSFNGNSDGCMVIQGTVSLADTGIYRLFLDITANLLIAGMIPNATPTIDSSFVLNVGTFQPSGVIDSCTYIDTTIVTIYDTVTHYDTANIYISVTDTLYIDIMLTAVPAPNNKNTIKVYPNPANDVVIIDNGNFTAINNYSLTITNSLGLQVFSSLISIPQFQIPISTMGSVGLYYIQIFDGNNNLVETKQLILH